jgi:hypothetical protein
MITAPGTDERALHVEAHRVLLAPASGRQKERDLRNFRPRQGFLSRLPGLQNQLNNQQKALLPQ